MFELQPNKTYDLRAQVFNKSTRMDEYVPAEFTVRLFALDLSAYKYLTDWNGNPVTKMVLANSSDIFSTSFVTPASGTGNIWARLYWGRPVTPEDLNPVTSKYYLASAYENYTIVQAPAQMAIFSSLFVYYEGGDYGWLDAKTYPYVPSGVPVYLGIGWINAYTSTVKGHIDLIDENGNNIPSYSNNDMSALPNNGKIVGFGPFRVPEPGPFRLTAYLTVDDSYPQGSLPIMLEGT